MPRRIVAICTVLLLFITFFSISSIGMAEAKEVIPGNRSAAGKALVLEPGLDASIVGANEFSPGSKSMLQISVQNNSIVDKLDVVASQGGFSQLYGAAVSLTLYLEEGNAPIKIKGGKVLLGTLSSGAATPAIPFELEVNEDADPGEYTVNLTMKYRMLNEVNTSGTSEADAYAEFDWFDQTQEIFLGIVIKEEFLKFEVIGVNSHLRIGANNDVQIEFKNSSEKVARDAEVELSANSPLTLTQNSAFLGTLEPDAAASGKFGIKVDGDAIPTEYSLDAVMKYRDISGNEYVTKAIKVPVTVTQGFSITQIMNSMNINTAIFVVVVIAFIIVIWLILKSRSRKKIHQQAKQQVE